MKEDPSDEALIRLRVYSDYQVVCFLHHIDGPVLCRDLEPDLRKLEGEAGGKFAHRRLGEEQRRANSQSSLRVVPAGSDRRSGLVEFGEQLAGPLKKRSPFLSQLQRARSPFKQAQVEVGFQFRHTAGQGCFRATRGSGGFSKAFVTGDQIEIGKSKKVHMFHP